MQKNTLHTDLLGHNTDIDCIADEIPQTEITNYVYIAPAYSLLTASSYCTFLCEVLSNDQFTPKVNKYSTSVTMNVQVNQLSI